MMPFVAFVEGSLHSLAPVNPLAVLTPSLLNSLSSLSLARSSGSHSIASLPNPLRRLMVIRNSGRKPITDRPKKGSWLKDFAAV